MSKRLQFARPMVRRRAGFHTNKARRQILEKNQDATPLQLPADDHSATGINAVNLKN
jgi:hypothetical protein